MQKDTTDSKEKYQEDTAILTIYASNIRAPKFIKETLLHLKSHIEFHAVIVHDFKMPISAINMSLKQKLNREILELNNTI